MKNKILLLSSVLLVACSGNKNNSLAELLKQESELKVKLSEVQTKIAELKKDSAEAIYVSVEKLQPRIFKSYLSFQGKVDAEDNISISSQMPGTITKINVKVGDVVQEGQVLAETDSRAVQQSIQALQSNLDFVNQLYEKQKSLWEQKIGTEVQYLQVKAQKENLEKTLASLQEQIRMTKIISPIAGTIDAVDIKVGQMVAPGMPAIRVINYNNLKVKADIPEAYISKINIGNPVKVILPEINDSIFSKISYTSKSINVVSRTFTAEVYFGNNAKLHPNQNAILYINNYTSESPVIIVPISYIQTEQNGSKYVYVVENNRAKKKEIKTGYIYEGNVEILSGLSEGTLLIKSAVNLKDNDPVIIQSNSVL